MDSAGRQALGTGGSPHQAVQKGCLTRFLTTSARERRLITVGKIVGIWGVDGWVKIYSYSRDRTAIFRYGHWNVGTGEKALSFELESGYKRGHGLVAKLRGLDDRDTAAAIVGAAIQVTSDQLPALEEGEFFWHQLDGLVVETLDGTRLGTVDYLIETGANDVLVVTGDRERLIPYIRGVVQRVDLESGIVHVDWDIDF